GRTRAMRLQVHPPQPVARRDRLVWEEPEIVQKPDRVAAPPLFLAHQLPLAQQVWPIHHRFIIVRRLLLPEPPVRQPLPSRPGERKPLGSSAHLMAAQTSGNVSNRAIGSS